MKVLISGHVYQLDLLDKEEGPPLLDPALVNHLTGYELMVFLQRGVSGCTRHSGYTCQEVLRVLIDRVKYLDDEQAWTGNTEILYHLRSALLLFEHRAAMRHVANGELWPEYTPVGEDGHFLHGVKRDE